MSRINQLIAELCPNGVPHKYLKDISQINRGVRVVKSQLSETEGFPVFQNSLTPLGYNDKANVKANSAFVIAAGAAGEIGFSDRDFWAADDCYYFLSDELNNRFLFHMLLQKQSLLLSKVRKASIPRLARSSIEQISVPVPPLPVQEEIVRILDAFTGLEAELEAELEARKKQYEHYRDNLLCNSNFEEKLLLDLLAQPITDGPHETPKFQEKGIPFISAESIQENKIDLSKKRGFISLEYHNQCCKKYKPQKNDVFMVKSGSTTGKVAFVDVDDEFNVWSPIAAMRVNEHNSARYVFYLLQTKAIQSQVKRMCSKGSQPNLSMRVLEKFKVRIPCLAEQERIVDLLDKLFAITHSSSSGLPAEIEARRKQYEYYRDKLLTFKELEA